MPVEDATRRIWLWFHMPQEIPGMGSVGYFQKNAVQVIEDI
jgi:hypothetical protein